MKYVTLALIFLSSFILFTSCNGYPKITLHQLDVNHNVINPNFIKSYDENKCELDLEQRQPFQLCMSGSANPAINGWVLVSKEDYSKIKAKAKADCENRKPQPN